MNDIDEIRRKLEEMGIPVGGEWGPTKARTNVEPPIVKRQKEALRKVEGILEAQLQEDQKRVADLHVVLQRLKHGGGVSRG